MKSVDAESLAVQGAPESQILRLRQLTELCSTTPACLALCLVGSYANGSGDRISDLDLVAFTRRAHAAEFLEDAHKLLGVDDVLDSYYGTVSPGTYFRKYVFLDFTSCELYVSDVPTSFKLRRPYAAIWDPAGLLSTLVVDGAPPRHEDFDAYQHGDAGLIWELVDCIKWLKRDELR